MFRPRTPLALIALVLVVALASPAAADDVLQKHEATQKKLQDVTKQLNVAKADESQLEAAVNTLDKAVASQEAKLEASQAAVWSADQTLAATETKYNDAKSREDALRGEIESRAVEAYVHPAGSLLEDLLNANNLAEVGRRVALLDHVQATSSTLLDQYKSVRTDLAESKKAFEQAKQQASARRDAVEAAAQQLQQDRDKKQQAHDEQARRVAELQSESAALLAEDAKIQAIIAERSAANAPALAALKAQGGGNANPSGRNFKTPSGGGFIWPVHGPVTSEFGPRWGSFHPGIDIGVPSGTPIAAAKAGVISYAGWNDGGYGNLVIIDHGDGFATAYGHQSRVASQVGQTVQQGQTVGYSGCTGNCSGDHVHFEIRVNGTAQNPRNYEAGGP